MKIISNWKQPVSLNYVQKDNLIKDNLIYDYNLKGIPPKPGCYVFYNKHGKSHSILYIGQADNLRRRLEQQQNNLRLMVGLSRSLRGKKYVVFCTIKLKQGQSQKKVLKLVEESLIDIALSSGNELLNIQGTKNKYDTIVFSGNRDTEKMFQRRINIPK